MKKLTYTLAILGAVLSNVPTSGAANPFVDATAPTLGGKLFYAANDSLPNLDQFRTALKSSNLTSRTQSALFDEYSDFLTGLDYEGVNNAVDGAIIPQLQAQPSKEEAVAWFKETLGKVKKSEKKENNLYQRTVDAANKEGITSDMTTGQIIDLLARHVMGDKRQGEPQIMTDFRLELQNKIIEKQLAALQTEPPELGAANLPAGDRVKRYRAYCQLKPWCQQQKAKKDVARLIARWLAENGGTLGVAELGALGNEWLGAGAVFYTRQEFDAAHKATVSHNGTNYIKDNEIRPVEAELATAVNDFMSSLNLGGNANAADKINALKTLVQPQDVAATPTRHG